MRILTIPTLKDNYAYLLIDQMLKVAAVVDPVLEPAKLDQVLKKENLDLNCIITTHHHWDHSSGNLKIKSIFPGIKVYGGDERIEGLTDLLKDSDKLQLGSIQITAISTKGHTSDSHKAVFSGDTLFIAGCGRFFEGTPKDMHVSFEKLSQLPDDTLVYPGHEYTRANCKFALSVDELNQDLVEYNKKIQSVECTVPSSIGLEKKINPFMRLNAIGKFKMNEPIECMRLLRELKNNY